jgi:tRNA (adenine37-N6)-methyltransferase
VITVKPVAFVRGGRSLVVDDYWGDVRAEIVLADDLPTESLDGLETFSHAEIIFFFDKLPESSIVAGARHPRENTSWPRVGIFAQRGKARPNRLGVTIVEIEKRDGRTLHVRGLDAVDGTPVIDIKPVIAQFLPRTPVRQPDWAGELMRDYWKSKT